MEVNQESRVVQIGMPVVGIVLFGLVWVSVTEVFGLLDTSVLPSPFEVYTEFDRVQDLILDNMWVTFRAGLLGYLLAIVLSTVTSVLVTVDETVRDTFMPFIIGGNTLPRVAVAPLIIFYIDVTTMASMLVAAWVAFFPMLANLIEGLESTGEDELRFFEITGATTWQEYRYLRFPNALPFFFDALKLGLITAMVGAIVGEFVASSVGLGYLALLSLQAANTTLALAIVFIVGVVTTVLIYVIYLLEAKLMFWKEPSLFSG